jgi:hypothetical protein
VTFDLAFVGLHWGEMLMLPLAGLLVKSRNDTWNLATNIAFTLGPRKVTENLDRFGSLSSGMAGVVGSNPTRGMDVCAFILLVLSCSQVEVLRPADPPSKESYRLCIRLRNRKGGQGPIKGL